MKRAIRLGGWISLLAASTFALAACASDADAPPNEEHGAPPASPSATPAPSAEVEPPAPPCDGAQTEAIKRSFEDVAKIPADVGAVAIIKDRSCGTRYFTRGASKDVPQTALHLIGSATKTYVASTILLLAEEGKLSLSDSVKTWIPDVPGGDAVKVDHLLRHTSGIYNYTGDPGYVFGMLLGLKKKYEPRDLIDIAFKRPLNFPPGTEGKWDYSNTGYVLLGMIIEKVTGRGVAEVLRDRILTPIGAKSTIFAGPEPLQGDVAVGTTFLGSNGAGFMDPSASWSCGNMAATIGDLADWTEKRGNGTFHSAATQAALTKGVATGATFTYGAALVEVAGGDKAVLHGNGPAIGHGGDTPGYHTVAYYFPKKKATLTMILDSDRGPSGSYPLAPTYLADLYDLLVDPYFGTAPPAQGM